MDESSYYITWHQTIMLYPLPIYNRSCISRQCYAPFFPVFHNLKAAIWNKILRHTFTSYNCVTQSSQVRWSLAKNTAPSIQIHLWFFSLRKPKRFLQNANTSSSFAIVSRTDSGARTCRGVAPAPQWFERTLMALNGSIHRLQLKKSRTNPMRDLLYCSSPLWFLMLG